MQILHVVCLERYSSIEHGVENYSCGPHIGLETLIASVTNDLWCYISGCSALLTHDFTWLYLLANTKVCYLYHALSIQQDVVKLDISVKNVPCMKVT